jgi:hypothetical protein
MPDFRRLVAEELARALGVDVATIRCEEFFSGHTRAEI